MSPSQAPMQSWSFIGQALNDFCNSLPPSAAEAFREVTAHHIARLQPILIAGIDKLVEVDMARQQNEDQQTEESAQT